MQLSNNKISQHKELRIEDLNFILTAFKRRYENVISIIEIASLIDKALAGYTPEYAQTIIYQILQYETYRKSQEKNILSRYAGIISSDPQMRR